MIPYSYVLENIQVVTTEYSNTISKTHYSFELYMAKYEFTYGCVHATAIHYIMRISLLTFTPSAIRSSVFFMQFHNVVL